ncbi:hypothetical protein KIPB_004702 [Kipferlia bialata]|uniref:Uncharacterized protein n=1 Tax=Kipferlia bialata TaxID=797122 RepID=A0A9K3CVW7_9EUKA|nr:hypothetical protein KIPB_004702 [Kipferlia bialata]|eukprot:g4702.t1
MTQPIPLTEARGGEGASHYIEGGRAVFNEDFVVQDVVSHLISATCRLEIDVVVLPSWSAKGAKGERLVARCSVQPNGPEAVRALPCVLSLQMLSPRLRRVIPGCILKLGLKAIRFRSRTLTKSRAVFPYEREVNALSDSDSYNAGEAGRDGVDMEGSESESGSESGSGDGRRKNRRRKKGGRDRPSESESSLALNDLETGGRALMERRTELHRLPPLTYLPIPPSLLAPKGKPAAGTPAFPRASLGATPISQTIPGTHSLAYSRDGSLLAAGVQVTADTSAIRLHDPDTGTLLADLGPHFGPIYSLAFNETGSLLACASGDGVVSVWWTGPVYSADSATLPISGAETSSCLWAVIEHASPVYAVSFLPLSHSDSGEAPVEYLASAGLGECVSLWVLPGPSQHTESPANILLRHPIHTLTDPLTHVNALSAMRVQARGAGDAPAVALVAADESGGIHKWEVSVCDPPQSVPAAAAQELPRGVTLQMGQVSVRGHVAYSEASPGVGVRSLVMVGRDAREVADPVQRQQVRGVWSGKVLYRSPDGTTHGFDTEFRLPFGTFSPPPPTPFPVAGLHPLSLSPCGSVCACGQFDGSFVLYASHSGATLSVHYPVVDGLGMRGRGGAETDSVYVPGLRACVALRPKVGQVATGYLCLRQPGVIASVSGIPHMVPAQRIPSAVPLFTTPYTHTADTAVISADPASATATDTLQISTGPALAASSLGASRTRAIPSLEESDMRRTRLKAQEQQQAREAFLVRQTQAQQEQGVAATLGSMQELMNTFLSATQGGTRR